MLDISGIKRLQFDVLVIGAGGAGLSAAIAASQEEGIRVGLCLLYTSDAADE